MTYVNLEQAKKLEETEEEYNDTIKFLKEEHRGKIQKL